MHSALVQAVGPQGVLEDSLVLPGTEPVRTHVRATRPGVETALDVLLAGTVLVDGGWQAALDVALAHPGTVAVTSRGDRFTAASWRLGASRAAITRRTQVLVSHAKGQTGSK